MWLEKSAWASARDAAMVINDAAAHENIVDAGSNSSWGSETRFVGHGVGVEDDDVRDMPGADSPAIGEREHARGQAGHLRDGRFERQQPLIPTKASEHAGEGAEKTRVGVLVSRQPVGADHGPRMAKNRPHILLVDREVDGAGGLQAPGGIDLADPPLRGDRLKGLPGLIRVRLGPCDHDLNSFVYLSEIKIARSCGVRVAVRMDACPPLAVFDPFEDLGCAAPVLGTCALEMGNNDWEIGRLADKERFVEGFADLVKLVPEVRGVDPPEPPRDFRQADHFVGAGGPGVGMARPELTPTAPAAIASSTSACMAETSRRVAARPRSDRCLIRSEVCPTRPAKFTTGGRSLTAWAYRENV